MTYFDFTSLAKCFPLALAQHRVALTARRHRPQLSGFSQTPSWGLLFQAGDILKYSFDRGPSTFFFEGLCLSLRNRGFGRKQTSFISRNVMTSVGVEVLIAYFLRRLYKLSFSDYKRKQFFYNQPRLYFLRDRLNRESRVR